MAASILLPTNPEVSVAAGPRFGISGTGVDVDVTLMQQIQIAGERPRIDAADALRDLTDAELNGCVGPCTATCTLPFIGSRRAGARPTG